MVTLDQAGAGRDFTEIHLPPPRLARAVVHLFVIHNVAEAHSCSSWRIVPDMSPHLLAHFTERGLRVSVVGARTVFVDRPQGTRYFTVGARLVPGTLPLLFKYPATDFIDKSIAIEEISGSRGSELKERLESERSPAVALSLISEFLSQIMDPALQVDWRIRWLQSLAKEQRGRLHVADLAREMGVATRTLRQVAGDTIGLSPKQFARIHRLFAALELGLGESRGWAQVAAATRYADQAHMIREFQSLLGESPEVYRRRSIQGRF